MRTLHVPGLRVDVYPDEESLGSDLADAILGGVLRAASSSRRYLLGCPGGRSLRSTYQALGRLAGERRADLSGLIVVMMDEYLIPAAGGPRNCSPQAHFSCHRFAQEEIVDVLNAGLPPARRLPRASVWFPDPADPAAYDRRIEDAGGVDLFLTASGASDGHVAFNPPGSSLDSPSRIVEIAEATRRDNLSTFPEFRALDEVPRFGVSVGLGTIARLSAEVVMVITGAHKAAAVRRLIACQGFDPCWPASFLYRVRNGRVLLDEAAAGEGARATVLSKMERTGESPSGRRPGP